VASLVRRADRLPAPDLLIADEAHHALAATWQQLFATWPLARALGVSATPERLDGRGLGEVFGTMVLGPSVADLIRTGHLAAFDYFAPERVADLSDVGVRAGDFARDALAEAMDRPAITGNALAHYRRLCPGAQALAFCTSVRHAENAAEQFRAAGFEAASVDGALAADERNRLVRTFAAGELRILASCELLSEGFDVPAASAAILLRPTQSLGLHLQQVGRVLRPKPNGSRAVVLDHVGNVGRHSGCRPRARVQTRLGAPSVPHAEPLSDAAATSA
jgi:DNA repair protein RadD